MATSDTFTYSFSNFDEPEPLANKKATILAVVIAFMVRDQQFAYTTRPREAVPL